MAALVTSEIFRLFRNTLTPDDNYSSRYMQISWQQLQRALSQKGLVFLVFFIAFLKCAWNLEHFEKKRRVSQPNYYQNYCIRKRCLLKRLKGLASAHHSVINVLTGSKHCWSQHGTTIFLFFNEFEIIELENGCLSHIGNLQTVCQHVDSRWQVFPSLYADFLTTTSKAVISKRNCFFSIFDCISEMCMKFRTFWEKRKVSYPNYYRNYCIQNRCLLQRLKGLASAHHSVINVLTGSKHCRSQHGTTILIFSHEFDINWVGKGLP